MDEKNDSKWIYSQACSWLENIRADGWVTLEEGAQILGLEIEVIKEWVNFNKPVTLKMNGRSVIGLRPLSDGLLDKVMEKIREKEKKEK